MDQTMVKVGEARLNDLEALCNLLGLLFDQEVEFESDRTKQKTALKEILLSPVKGRIYKATYEGQLVGMINILYLPSTALGATVSILEDIIINPEFRRRGIGTLLLKHAITESKKQGIQRITLLTDHDNEAGQSLYKKFGFQKSKMDAYRLLMD